MYAEIMRGITIVMEYRTGMSIPPSIVRIEASSVSLFPKPISGNTAKAHSKSYLLVLLHEYTGSVQLAPFCLCLYCCISVVSCHIHVYNTFTSTTCNKVGGIPH